MLFCFVSKGALQVEERFFCPCRLTKNSPGWYGSKLGLAVERVQVSKTRRTGFLTLRPIVGPTECDDIGGPRGMAMICKS